MLEQPAVTEKQSRELVERLAASRYLAKSARLRDLLLFLSDRALAGSGEIHEQEVGHHVFGRPANYDTGSDNIVRVHASTLRRRLELYFAREGAAEPLIVEIPRGNYAPVFRKREAAGPPRDPVAPEPPLPSVRRDWRIAVLATAALLFAVSTAALLLRGPHNETPIIPRGPTVRMFWSEIFHPGQPTDVVLDDAGVALYQELTGRTVTLSEYFDRSYLRNIRPGLRVDIDTANALVQRRQSSFANVSFLGRLRPMAGFESRDTAVVFARDYSFRQIKNDNAVLLGQLRSNPWIEPFLPHVGVRWTYDGGSATYYPSDTWAPGEPKVFRGSDSAETHESYCWIALLPNLGGNGNVLIVSATGGSAFNAGATFLADESAMQTLRNRLPAGKRFPHFEALLQVKGRSAQPRDAVVVICRLARGDSS